MPNWSYDLLVRKADLIIVATPVGVRDTVPRAIFPKLEKVTMDEQHKIIPAIWIETTFERLAVLKGDDPGAELVLHHLRWASAEGLDGTLPRFVSFDPTKKKRYLLFLKRDGERWVPLTGPIDPIYGVKELGESP